MAPAFERVPRAEQEDQAEQVPLPLDEGVGAQLHADRTPEVARHGVERPQHDHDEHEPADQRTRAVRQAIDRAD